MHISKNILQGVLLGLSTISLTAKPSDATAQKIKEVPGKIQQPKDTARQAGCVKFDPKLSPGYKPYAAPGSQVSTAASDSTVLIYKDPCITCGRG
ncbi:MAG: hypothetical protein JNM21_16445 [Taibaiella sp.]|nr:hypothetical protein [Taibaiella sp.]